MPPERVLWRRIFEDLNEFRVFELFWDFDLLSNFCWIISSSIDFRVFESFRGLNNFLIFQNVPRFWIFEFFKISNVWIFKNFEFLKFEIWIFQNFEILNMSKFWIFQNFWIFQFLKFRNFTIFSIEFFKVFNFWIFQNIEFFKFSKYLIFQNCEFLNLLNCWIF